jgi:hypothetical protein
MDDVKRQGIHLRWQAGKFKKRGKEAEVRPKGKARLQNLFLQAEHLFPGPKMSEGLVLQLHLD